MTAARLAGADLTGANITGATFLEADLNSAQLINLVGEDRGDRPRQGLQPSARLAEIASRRMRAANSAPTG